MADAEVIRRAKALLDQLSERPRFAGSPEEAQARTKCREELERAGCRRWNMDELEDRAGWAAERVAQGHVVGWFQGRAEWGARALGNRQQRNRRTKRHQQEQLRGRVLVLVQQANDGGRRPVRRGAQHDAEPGARAAVQAAAGRAFASWDAASWYWSPITFGTLIVMPSPRRSANSDRPLSTAIPDNSDPMIPRTTTFVRSAEE